MSTQQPSFLPPNYVIKPRSSTETDRRHLLSDSIAPSESASVVSYGAGDQTPRPRSPAASATIHTSSTAEAQNDTNARRETIATPAPQPYRGFPSEAHYLAALNEWANSKRYVNYDSTLVGFYGEKSIEHYTSQPKMTLGLRKMLRERKERKEARRSTVV